MKQVNRTYQYRGYCTRGGHGRIDDVLYECAYLYNSALRERREVYRMGRLSLSYYDQGKSFTGIRREFPQWADLSLQVGVECCVDSTERFSRSIVVYERDRSLGFHGSGLTVVIGR